MKENSMHTITLTSPIQYVKKVGPKRAELFARLGINTVEDLLWFVPRRYEDRTQLKSIDQLREGDTETIVGEVVASGEVKTRSRLKIFQAAVRDDTGVIYVTWFNQPYLKEYFKPEVKVVLYGKITRFRGRKLQMNVPEYEIIEKDEIDSIHMGGIVPIYPATEGLNQKLIRTIVRSALGESVNEVEEVIPSDIRANENLLPIRKALWNMHFPENMTIYQRARRRMVFDEFFLLQLGVGLRKHQVEYFIEGIEHKNESKLADKFIESLPFKLTGAQKKVIEDIKIDMQSKKPMNRLLQGDVGSGKTVVAVYALIKAVGCGYQGAIMAPTEILARQHYNKLKAMLKNLGIKITILVGDSSVEERKKVLGQIAKGKVDIIIGTHALIQEGVVYKKLGMVVIDEQHKFGVHQRAVLGTKAEKGLGGLHPDVLVMTATPIPRSLALTVYGDMDLSIIDELPPGRGKVVTYWITEEKLSKAYDFVRKEIAGGRQAYIVYPLVEESEKINLKAAKQMLKKLQTEVFPELRLGLVHGKLSSDKKTEIMEQFKEGKINILVATTVIEVGIDIPNATVMLIEHAERFGLSQLHQLRGRIGRGSYHSYCILQGNPGTSSGLRRLKVMKETTDGFKISEEDLAIRGPGEFFGTHQHGMPQLKIGNIISDIGLVELTRREAKRLLEADPGLKLPDNRKLFLRVKHMYGDKLELVSV